MDLRFRVSCVGFSVSCVGFGVSGFGIWGLLFGFNV